MLGRFPVEPYQGGFGETLHPIPIGSLRQDRRLVHDTTESVGEGCTRSHTIKDRNDVLAEPEIDAVAVDDE
jgi:hypothetical protein